jgi:ABC-2 type transport system ATP-binding protein
MIADMAIATHGLTCRFGNLVAVDHLDLQVPRGIVFGFLGQNGAGKTTTIRMLLGLLEASEGSATVLGFDIASSGQSIRERTGALMEHNGLYERMTAEENLEYFGRIYRLPPGERRQRIRELLTHMSLWERRNELVGTWSKGMRQKLAVLRSILHHPPLVFLDEPTSGLDPLATVDLRADLLSLKAQEGMTVFLNTHNLPEAQKLCDLVGIIHHGRLLVVAPPGDLVTKGPGLQLEIIGSAFSQALVERLRTHPEVLQAELTGNTLQIRPANEQAVDGIIALVAQSGSNIQTIHRGTADLEAVFVNLVEGAAHD